MLPLLSGYFNANKKRDTSFFIRSLYFNQPCMHTHASSDINVKQNIGADYSQPQDQNIISINIIYYTYYITCNLYI